MIHVWMLALLTFSFQAIAADFNHVKLHPQFEQYLTRPQMKSFAKFQQQRLLGQGQKTDSPFPASDDASPLYEEIRNQLEASHNEIGQREVGQIDLINRQFNLGTQNLSGFSWQKPFGVVHVYADRQVTPNIMGSNYLIQDTFTLEIEATSFLEGTNNAGITSMSPMEIGAFAGLTFKRVYTYWHYADSYMQGIRADFSKLFLPFLRWNKAGLEKMGTDEIMKREDTWSAKAGGLITTPPLYAVSASAGVLGELAFHQMVSVQNNLVQDAASEKIRLNVKGSKSMSIGATLSLQLDFFKLLKLTLLQYDLNYEYALEREFVLGLSQNHLQQVYSDPNQNTELTHVLHGRTQIDRLEPYIVSMDESESSSLESKGSLLIWGRLQKTKTEQVRFIKDQVVKVFYKNYAQSVKVVQNLLSRIFSAVVYKVLKLPWGVKNAALYNKNVTLEYEATHPQSSDPNVARIDGSEQFSFVLTQSYEAARTDRWIDERFKNDVIWFVDAFTTLPKDYKSIIRNEQLKGPILVESNLRIEKAGFDYFLAQNEDMIFGQMAQVCGSRRKGDWMRAEKRAHFLKRLQVGHEACVKNIALPFMTFKQDYLRNSLKPSIAAFKSFLTKYYKATENLSDLVALFGEQNTFINGQLKAMSSQNTPFVTSFSSGQFRGLGVIDNFKRANGSRTPASIVSE